MVARHLNLCANARKELDRLRQGVKLPPVLDRPLDVPWDQKILNWLYRPKKAQDAVPANSQPRTQKRRPAPTSQGPVEETMAPPVKKSSLLRSPLLWLLVLLFGVILLTHLVQNAGQYRTIRSVQRWLARQGVPFCEQSRAIRNGVGGHTARPRIAMEFNNLHPNFSTEAPTILSDTRGVDFGPYLARIIFIVRRNWLSVIPESARLGEKGRVGVVFEILKDGSVPQLRLVASSGSDPLDRAAVNGIHASIPFPPLPQEFTGEHLVLQFIFLYNLTPQ